jgi:hypothetical protein
VAWARPGGSVRRVPSPPAACRRGACRRGACLRGACRHGAGRRGQVAGARGAASRGRAAVPPRVAWDHGMAWEVAAGCRGGKVPGRDRPGSSLAGSRDAAAEFRPGRATAGPGSTRRPAPLGQAAGRRSAGFPGCSGLPASRARDHPWARRAGRQVSTRSWASARTAGPNALRRRARRARCPRSQRRPGACPGRALVTCRALGATPRIVGGRLRAGDPAYPRSAGTFRLSRSARWRTPPIPPGRTRCPPRPRPAPAGSYAQADAGSKTA